MSNRGALKRLWRSLLAVALLGFGIFCLANGFRYGTFRGRFQFLGLEPVVLAIGVMAVASAALLTRRSN